MERDMPHHWRYPSRTNKQMFCDIRDAVDETQDARMFMITVLEILMEHDTLEYRSETFDENLDKLYTSMCDLLASL